MLKKKRQQTADEAGHSTQSPIAFNPAMLGHELLVQRAKCDESLFAHLFHQTLNHICGKLAQ
eukprot:4266755-Prymnesium_polylepis.2